MLTGSTPVSPVSQPAARPVSDRLTGTMATSAVNEGWPPGNGSATRKSASHKAGRTAAHLATNGTALRAASCRSVIEVAGRPEPIISMSRSGEL